MNTEVKNTAKEMRQIKERVTYMEKTLRLFSYAAIGNAVAVLIMGINLLRIVFQW